MKNALQQPKPAVYKEESVPTELRRYLKETFPSDEAKWEFMENSMLANGALLMKKLQDEYESMSPGEAGKVGALLISKGLEIRKARENGFKEQTLSVSVIMKLEHTLNKLANEQITSA